MALCTNKRQTGRNCTGPEGDECSSSHPIHMSSNPPCSNHVSASKSIGMDRATVCLLLHSENVAQLYLQVSIQSLTSKSTSAALSSGLWGLDRIDQKSKKRDYMYHYSSVGTGVHVYTVDTVIDWKHRSAVDMLDTDDVCMFYLMSSAWCACRLSFDHV